MRRTVLVIALSLLSICALSTSGFSADVDADTRKGWETIAATGPGFVVWESSRTGDWRIWRMNLDGTGMRQLSPDEKGRDHFCPHISPDGKRLIYLSYPKGFDAYKDHESSRQIPMYLMSADGRFNRVLIPSARAYGEDRAVVWIDDDRLIYIDGEGNTCEFTISTGRSSLLVSQTKPEFGFLVNAQKTFAVPGWPASFNPYDPATGKVTAARELGGCQPYFSSDGAWGFWMGSGGGPINRFNLTTGQIAPIIGKGDGRMPAGRNYLYFPMLSHNRRLFAFGASPGQHDHFKSDYDIFIARIDPRSLELIGKPVRYTFDPACDRFPDVYVADLALGDLNGEAPFTAKFAATDAGNDWVWSFGDGSSGAGSSPAHTYTKAGEYQAQARRGDVTLCGRVSVQPTKAPRVVSASLRGDREIAVAFSEPVSLSGAAFTLASGLKIERVVPSADKLGAALTLAKPLTKTDRLRISGVRDLAQKPNTIVAESLDIMPHSWPSDSRGLVMLWENGRKGCVTASGERFPTQAVGRATLNGGYALRLCGGSYTISGADDSILKACKRSNALTIEATIITADAKQDGPARILTLSSSPQSRDFTLGQAGDRLILRLRTPQTGENGTEPQVDLCAVTPGKPMRVMVSYSPGELLCYVNGRQALKTEQVKGGFENWSAHHLLIGDEYGGQRAWRGSIEGIAVYSRTFSAAEASRSYESYAALHRRTPAPVVRVKATLVSSSPMPTLEEIKPYREALVLREYRVDKTLEGDCRAKTIRVAGWAIVGGEVVGGGDASQKSVTLDLESFSSNPQLESVYMSDTLDPDPDIPMYYDPAL